MKILLVNSTDTGGAGVATFRLFECLRNQGIDVRVLLLKAKKPETLANKRVWAINNKSFGAKLLYALRNKLERNILGNQVKNFSLGKWGISLYRHPWVAWADVVHLHWINDCFVSLKDLHLINKPLFWTMHDMWPFSCGFHYINNQWKMALPSNEELTKPLTLKVIKNAIIRKEYFYKNKTAHLVSPSVWLSKEASASALVTENNIPVSVIPNPINCKLFSSGNREVSRIELGLALHKKIILFGSFNVLSDERKGFKELVTALKNLHEKHPNLKDEVELAVLGHPNEQLIADIPFKTHFLGFATTEKSLPLYYHAADVFVLPSLQDNLPNMCLESLASGIPVVAFDIGGLPDMVTHNENGFLAKDTIQLADFINEALFYKNWDKEQIQNQIKSLFGYKVIGKQFIELYKNKL